MRHQQKPLHRQRQSQTKFLNHRELAKSPLKIKIHSCYRYLINIMHGKVLWVPIVHLLIRRGGGGASVIRPLYILVYYGGSFVFSPGTATASDTTNDNQKEQKRKSQYLWKIIHHVRKAFQGSSHFGRVGDVVDCDGRVVRDVWGVQTRKIFVKVIAEQGIGWGLHDFFCRRKRGCACR